MDSLYKDELNLDTVQVKWTMRMRMRSFFLRPVSRCPHKYPNPGWAVCLAIMVEMWQPVTAVTK